MPIPVLPANVADSYNMLRNAATNAQQYLAQVQVDIAAGEVNGFYFISALGMAVTLLGTAQTIVADTTLSAALDTYVRMMVGVADLDVHGELATSMGAMVNVVGAMVTEYPKSADGYLRDRKFVNGIVEWDAISGSSLTATNAAITAWMATIF